jgi:hypothetical protein
MTTVQGPEQEVCAAYRRTRNRVCALMLTADLSDRHNLVPACAPWRAQDLLAHVVSMPAALIAGRTPTGEITTWLGELIAERSEQSSEELVAEWLNLDPELPGLLSGRSAVLFGDLAVHEHDLRGALQKPDHGALEIEALMPRTLAGFANPLRSAGLGAIAVAHEDHVWRSHDAAPGWTLHTDPWTAVRAINSRRTGTELMALEATGDVVPYLAILDAHLPLPHASLGE